MQEAVRSIEDRLGTIAAAATVQPPRYEPLIDHGTGLIDGGEPLSVQNLAA